jgi:hypothetical protein
VRITGVVQINVLDLALGVLLLWVAVTQRTAPAPRVGCGRRRTSGRIRS